MSGSRGLHGGTPASRPPPEGAASNTNRPSWPVAPSNYDNSALASYLKSRREASPGIKQPGGALNLLRRPTQSELGKWGKSTPLISPYPKLQTPRMDPLQVMKERRPATPAASSDLPSRKSPSLSSEAQNNQRDQLSRRTPASKPAPSNNNASRAAPKALDAQQQYPFAKKSALDIEKDLFAGISSEAPKPYKPQPRSPAMIDSVISNFGREIRTSPATSRDSVLTDFTTSHSKLVQPLRLAPETIQKTLNHIRKSEREPPVSPAGPASGVPVQQFAFLSARARPAVAATSERQATTDSSSFSAPPEKAGRAGGSGWISSSREAWDDEVPNNEEQPAETESEMFKEGLEEYLSPEKSKKQKKKELEMLKKRAKVARFKLSVKDIAHWQPEAQKVEAPGDIITSNTLYIPPSISVVNFSNLLKIPLSNDWLYSS